MLKQTERKETFFDNYVWNNFIPKEHRYVKIKELINVDFIPALVKDTYKNENPQGNNAIDPKTLFLICIAEFLENLSDVKIVERIAEMPVLKWFVGLSPSDKVPDDSTVCKFRTQRMGDERFKEAFDNSRSKLIQFYSESIDSIKEENNNNLEPKENHQKFSSRITFFLTVLGVSYFFFVKIILNFL